MTQRALLLRALGDSDRWTESELQVTFPGTVFVGNRRAEQGDDPSAAVHTEFLVLFENDVLYLAEPGIVEVLTVVEARFKHVNTADCEEAV